MNVLHLPEFELESGEVLFEVPVAFRTWGKLNDDADNVVIVCHALTGDMNADDWWGDLVGPGRIIDTDRYFVVCANVIGSPYGTLSPLSNDPRRGRPYGAAFPEATIRDTVRLHSRLLDDLGVREVRLATGGSMGGMQVLEWALLDERVKAVAPIAVGARHSAWCIGWSEAQRQAIFADPNWNDGHYPSDAPPVKGLAAARMAAMISYRSRASFEERFGRDRMKDVSGGETFAVSSYLRYQGVKLVERFDANCYVHLTYQMDTHDIGRGRNGHLEALRQIEIPALVIGIDSDGLYPLEEQAELAEYLPKGELAVIKSAHGHDAFLIEFNALESIFSSWIDSNEPTRQRSTPISHVA